MIKIIKAWTWQAIAIYLLAEFAIFTISSRLMHTYYGKAGQPSRHRSLLDGYCFANLSEKLDESSVRLQREVA